MDMNQYLDKIRAEAAEDELAAAEASKALLDSSRREAIKSAAMDGQDDEGEEEETQDDEGEEEEYEEVRMRGKVDASRHPFYDAREWREWAEKTAWEV
jgi:hypothetical protein